MAFRSLYILRSGAAVFTAFVGLLFTGLLPQAQQSQPQPQSQPQTVNFSPRLLSTLKRIQQAALTSDHALRQVSYLSNSIGPSWSAATDSEMKSQVPGQRLFLLT